VTLLPVLRPGPPVLLSIPRPSLTPLPVRPCSTFPTPPSPHPLPPSYVPSLRNFSRCVSHHSSHSDLASLSLGSSLSGFTVFPYPFRLSPACPPPDLCSTFPVISLPFPLAWFAFPPSQQLFYHQPCCFRYQRLDALTRFGPFITRFTCDFCRPFQFFSCPFPRSFIRPLLIPSYCFHRFLGQQSTTFFRVSFRSLFCFLPPSLSPPHLVFYKCRFALPGPYPPFLNHMSYPPRPLLILYFFVFLIASSATTLRTILPPPSSSLINPPPSLFFLPS